MDDSHDVHVGKLVPHLRANNSASHDRVPSDLPASPFLHAFGNSPMEERIEPGDPLSSGRGFHVFQKGGKTSDCLPLIEGFDHAVEGVDIHASPGRPGDPRMATISSGASRSSMQGARPDSFVG